jgi:hypothetical protein
MILIKKMVLPALALLSSAGYAEHLVTFSDIADAVLKGKKLL